MKHHKYLIACVLPFLFPYFVFSDKTAQRYISEGSAYLINGKLNDALISFDAAIRLEPDNYLSYFKRATTYLTLGRNSAAAEDFTKILDLKPDFDKALLQRARIYVKDGNFEFAIRDLEKYLQNNPNFLEAEQLLSTAKSTANLLKRALNAKEDGSYNDCISLASTVTRTSPSLVTARYVRAKCHIAKGEIVEAAGDLIRIAQLNPSEPEVLLLLSKINFYSLGEAQGALTYVKQCLHYDPEQKQCKKLFKGIKNLEKTIATIEKDIELKKFTTAHNNLIGTANRQGIFKQLDAETDLLEKELNSTIPKKLHLKCYKMACRLLGEQKERDEDKLNTWCSNVLEIEPNDEEALSYRGEVLLNRKEYEDAVRDLEKANELSEGSNQRIRQLLAQAQQKLKLSKKKDYYKMLGVSPTADSREIKKAYRKKAHEWHPDKYSGDLDKDEVERRMAEINQAYEVLSNPDMRQQYDNGFDPYDPEQGQGGPSGAGPMGGFPFQFKQGGFNFQNGFPFGGGGEFKMHFQ